MIIIKTRSFIIRIQRNITHQTEANTWICIMINTIAIDHSLNSNTPI